MLDALCYAELASRFPTSGGAYLFTKNVFGNPIALVVGLNLLFDYHIGAAAIARSFAGYLSNVLATVPDVHTDEVEWVEAIPVDGFLSLNFIAPILLMLLTAVLCRGASESATLNRVLTTTKVLTILVVIAAGASRVDPSLWSPAFPRGLAPVGAQTATLFFAYVGFDAVANSAEECAAPGRDIPIAIAASLSACALLYIGVVGILAGLVPYCDVDASAPLAAAFDDERGLAWARVVVSASACAQLCKLV
jgi:basic amino acid/polyamine antiporter, APA family